MGSLYEQGKGVPLDYVNAYQWYSLAIENGDVPSKAQLKNLSRLMTNQPLLEAIAPRTSQPPTPDALDAIAANSFLQRHQQIIPFH